MLKVMNRKNQHKSSLIFDELPTIYFRGLDTLIATARSNRISTLLGIQTIDQLIRDYGKEQANAILTNIGNIFAGQSVGDTAKFIQSRMGKILQERQSININRNMQSTSFSTQMDYLVPEGKIATLPQGYMVGQVTDNFGEQLGQKNFNCLVHIDMQRLEREEKEYLSIPDIYRVDNVQELLENNRNRIQNDIRTMVLQLPGEVHSNNQNNHSKLKQSKKNKSND